MSKGILFDSRLCIGCAACSEACRETHHLSGKLNPLDLDADNFTVLKRVDGYKVRNLCRHCLKPACASSCPVGALKKTPEGPVVYDANKCIGCRYCFVACPYRIPRYQWNSTRPQVRKCDFCVERQKQGEATACADACPAEATVFGERAELLKEAHARLEAEPQWYFPNVFGETEGGGSSVLIITSPVIVEKALIYPTIKTPLPELTAAAHNKVPFVGFGVGTMLCGIWWLSKRRNEVAAIEALLRKKEFDGK